MPYYHIYLFCGLLPWVWFSSCLLEGCNSIMSGASLVKRVMFPAEILPLVVIITNLIHFFLALPILFVFLAVYRIRPGWNILGFPLVVLIQFLFTSGLVLILSALSVHLRDIQQILNNIVTLWFFMSPIVYSINDLNLHSKPIIQFVLNLNPMKHIMVAYHRVFLQWMEGNTVNELPFNEPLPWIGLLGVFVFSLFILVLGYWIFNHFKVSFSEEI